jgi:hypothetical protein
MRPLSSPVRENRFLGLVEIAIGFFFAVVAGVLNPIEASVGIVAGALIVGSIMSVVRIRGAARETHAARPAPTREREQLDVFRRRIGWLVAGQLAVSLAVVAAARAPGLVAGITFGVGIALLVTARWLERWEDAHKISLLHERGRKGFYVAYPER